MRKKVGLFSENVVQKLGLEMAVGTPIYVADTNVEHMQKSHPEDYEKFGNELHNIIANPDYVGKNEKDDSIEFVKEYLVCGKYVKVAVRVSSRNVYYVRSMYALNPNRVKNFIKKGTLKKLDK